MKVFYFVVLLTLTAFLGLYSPAAFSQSILNPADPVVTYNASTPPTQPSYGTIGKWVRTKRLNWNTDSFRCYFYKGRAFRLRFPKTYKPGVSDGKTYPMLIFFHGAGEGSSSIYDNEYQLYHGGQFFSQSVDNGTWDGYVLAMQTTASWGPAEYAYTKELIDYMVTNNKLDPYHVVDNGLSAGGQGTWEMYTTYPTYISGLIPMSAVYSAYTDPAFVNKVKFTPIWNAHGGLDGAPAPYTAAQVLTAMQNGGANYLDKFYITLGHDTWDSTWLEPNFWPFLKAAYMSNPWTLFGRTQFCPGDPINVTIGLVAGFDSYQWRKNGVVIPGATSNTINATAIGTYDARILRGSVWSDWSRTPVVIGIKAPTVSPNITVSGLMSKVIPAPDGNTSVNIKVPSGYVSYLWQKVGNTATIGTDSILKAGTPGDYMVKVTEQFGCSSSFSNPFTVINAAGPNKPDAASSLTVAALSQTSLLLNWNQNPNPASNETNFEIYQGAKADGPYKLVAITAADVSKDTITGLIPNTKYFYVVRAVNNTATSAVSNEAGATTIADTQPPTAPANLKQTGSSQTSISISWGISTDNVGVSEYDIYVNGVKSYTVPPTQTSYTIYSLEHQQSYSIVVKAVDVAGNISTASNTISAEPLANGLVYSYYNNLPTNITAVPNFTTLTPAATGVSATPVLTPATDPAYFAFLWQGYIVIPTSGTYNFRTNSDDGSRLWLGSLNGNTSPYSFSGTPTVNNDGAHGGINVNSSNLNLQAGVYPIAIGYFNQGGGSGLTISWKIPGSFNYVTIPASAYAETPVVNGAVPGAPSNLRATALAYNKIGLSWDDNSNNESGFEVYRSVSATTGFAIVATTGTEATSFVDSAVAASTRYFYQVRAINQYGQSSYTSSYVEAEWKFNNSYADSTGNGRTLTTVGSPTFDNSTTAEGAYSLKLNGTNAGATIPNTSSFLQEAYAQRTISLWIRTSSTNVSNKVIFDIGGSDDGLALLLNSNKLIAAVASNNVRSNISANYTSTGWNHVAVVYKGDSLLLYINGSLAASTTSLSFHATTTTTNGARIGQTNGSNAYNNNGGLFTGWVDDFAVYNTALTQADIQNVENFTFVASNATTLAAPPVPALPTNLVAAGATPSTVNVTWIDNATNESGYQVYRSNNNDQNYVLLTTLPAGTTSFQDQGLFANAIYYYKVSAVNITGSTSSNPDSALTLDNPPVISQVGSQTARYGTTATIALTATDADAGTLTYSANNLPAFAALMDNGDRTAALVLHPAITDQGTYSGLTVIVKDAQGKADSSVFSLTVNDNYIPGMDTIVSYAISENDSLAIPLHAADQNEGDTLTWSVSNLPTGYKLTNVSNGSATLLIHPGYAAAGAYSVQVAVSDGKGGITTRSFGLVVNDKTPPTTKIYMRFQYQQAASAPWNNITGQSTTGLHNDGGAATPVGLQIQGNWFSTYNSGIWTGNNSGIYPDVILNEYFFFGTYPNTFSGPNAVTAAITGLDTTHRYSLDIYAGSAWGVQADNGTTTFTVGNQTIPIAVQNNIQNQATFSNLKAAADGTINFTAATGANTPVGYMNAIVLTSVYDDGTAPAAPRSLTAQDVPGQGAQLSWTDVAYNESGYEIYRTMDTTMAATLVGQAGANASSYIDTTAGGNTRYYYEVRAVNAVGSSAYSNYAAMTTSNRVPAIAAIANVVLHNDQQTTVNITATDDASDHVTLTVANLPAFAAFTDNGNGTGTITITPQAGSIGTFPNVTVMATDKSDSSRSTSFDISVVDKNVSSTYVMFSGGPVGPKPWNSFVNAPYAGATLTNLLDDGGNSTGMTVTLADGFQWFVSTGMRPGNGMTIYPEPVIRNGFYESSSATHTVRISGLIASKRYNFVFFNSHDDGFKCLTNFTINGQTVSLDGTYNINKTVQINGIAPDASGNVTISVAKAAGQDYAFLTTMIIQSYDPNVVDLLSPSDLKVINTARTAVTLQWADRATGETSIEVWRAASASGSYTLLQSLPAGTTTYTDNGLTANTTYYYTVRALKSGTSSDYSGAVAATTLVNAVYINYANGNQSPIPWNNTNTNPQLGWIWNNLYDELGATTNTGMTITKNFDGLYSAGVQTGNDSGIFPDKVMFDSYGLFPGDSAALKITGLNLAQAYNFTFFGSTTVWGDVNTSFTINGQSAMLNTSVNSTGTVTLYGIHPDANGEVSIGVAPGTSTSQFGLLGALIVSGYNATTSASAPVVPVVLHNTQVVAARATAQPLLMTPVVDQADSLLDSKEITGYPNPFTQSFTLVIPATAGDNVQVLIYDLSGRLVYGNKFSNLNEGNNYMTIQADRNFNRTGMYIIRVIYPDKPKLKGKTLKLIKK